MAIPNTSGRWVGGRGGGRKEAKQGCSASTASASIEAASVGGGGGSSGGTDEDGLFRAALCWRVLRFKMSKPSVRGHSHLLELAAVPDAFIRIIPSLNGFIDYIVYSENVEFYGLIERKHYQAWTTKAINAQSASLRSLVVAESTAAEMNAEE